MKTQRVISLVMLVAAAVISSASAHAAKYGTAGCGLGAVVWEDQPGKIQILAATVNNIVSPQTSAITSGTSNCVEDPKVASAMYIAVNEQALRKDISRGSGESLTGLSKILQCSNSAELGSALQKNYGTIFPSESTKPEAINQNIRSTIKSDGSLSKTCGSV